MKINILTDRLPDNVNINGAEYRINSDFRTSIRFEIMLRDKSIDDKTKMLKMLSMYYQQIPDDLNCAVEQILWFYNCGSEKKENQEDTARRHVSAPQKRNVSQYSFAQDAPYIYAAFREQFGINLQQISDNDLHWWEFIAMFKSLRDDTKMGQIMYYRAVSTSGMSNAKRKAINELKKIYKIKDDMDVESKVSLARRNAEMQAYACSRMHEARKEVKDD